MYNMPTEQTDWNLQKNLEETITEAKLMDIWVYETLNRVSTFSV